MLLQEILAGHSLFYMLAKISHAFLIKKVYDKNTNQQRENKERRDFVMIRTEFTFASALEGREIAAYSWKAAGKSSKGVVQIIHGMQEHAKCYDAFACFLAEQGFIVYACDHLGHGRSIQKESDFGYFGPDAGWKNIIEDQWTLTQYAKTEHPQLPLILLGHSMGSFVARILAAEHGTEYAMAIFLDTSGPRPWAKKAAHIAEHLGKVYGIKTPANRLGARMTKMMNRRIHHRRTDHDWLSTDADAVNDFILDPLCGREFTYGGYRDLLTLLAMVSEKNWAFRLPKTLPILLLSGKDDPVGDFGKGIRTLAKRLLAADCCKVSLKLYQGLRHVPLTDYRREEVAQDILTWILRYLP